MLQRIHFVLSAMLILLPWSATARSAEVASSTVSYPTFGLQIIPPAQSAAVPLPDGAGQVATYQLNPGREGPIILIEVISAQGQSVGATARSFADRAHAIAEPSGFDVGSEKAEIFSQAIRTDPYTRRTTYVVVHNGWAYVFSALDTTDTAASVALGKMLRSLKFTPAQAPSIQLKDFFDRPINVFGRFAINGPRILRPVDHTDTLLHLGIYDYRGKGRLANPLNLDIERIQTGTSKTFADIQEAYAANLQKSLNAPKAFIWKASKDVAGLYVSQPQKFKAKGNDGVERASTQRFCMLELAPGDFVQLLFSVSDLPDDEVAAYVDLSNQMLGTVEIFAAPAKR